MIDTDLIVIGAGAAGLSAGMYAARSGISVIMIDGSGTGGQIAQIDSLENYPGVFPATNGTSFTDTLRKQAESFGAKTVFAQVTSIYKKGSLFQVVTTKETYISPAVVYTTGAEHSKLNVPGESELYAKGVSYCAVCDGPFFKGRNVSVIGGGDSACSEALYLSGIAGHVDLFHRRGTLRAQEALSDQVLADPKITVHFNRAVKSIDGSGRVTGITVYDPETSKEEKFTTDAVFIFAGMLPRTELLETLPKDKAGYIIANEKMESPVKGLYIAGDVRSKPLRQIVTACSDGAIAGFFAAEYVKENFIKK